MINCDPNYLATQAACYCFGPREADAAAIWSLCQWANAETGGQFSYEPETELVVWNDGSGLQAGDLATFRSTAIIATTTFIKFNSSLITSVTGLSFLPALQEFEGGPAWLVTDLDFTGCSNLQKVTLDLSASTVTLNVSGCSSLTDLICPLNQITSLNVTGCTSLVNFDCDTNPNLTTITGLSTCSSLSVFVCFSCNLTGPLNLAGFTNLTALGCYNNNLTSVDVSGDTSLTFLNCSSNASLTTLTLTGCTALTTLDCSNCPTLGSLTDILTCTALSTLAADGLASGISAIPLDLHGLAFLSGITATNSKLAIVTLTNCTGILSCDFASSTVTSFVGLLTCSALTHFNCPGCANITSIDVHGLINLDYLGASTCSGLLTINCNGCVALDYLDGADNASLQTLDATNTLCTTGGLFAQNDPQLTTLILTGCSSMPGIDCHGDTLLASITDLDDCTALQGFVGYNSGLTSLNLSGSDGLVILHAYSSSISSVILSGLIGSLSDVDLHTNSLNTAAVDGLYSALNAQGIASGSVDLTGNAAPTGGCLNADIVNLNASSWTVAGCP